MENGLTVPEAVWVNSAAAVWREVLALGLGPFGSAVDFGCNVGAWLAAARRTRAVTGELLGLDAKPPAAQHPGARQLYAGEFRQVDLGKPLELKRRFDVALGLEVAEHLDGGDAAADTYIDTLTRHAPLILFSAAQPGQGGDHHVNEQWPEYWVRRFAARGFAVVDEVRWRVWLDDRVLWWYRQNLFLAYAPGSPAEAVLKLLTRPGVASVIHPARWHPARGLGG